MNNSWNTIKKNIYNELAKEIDTFYKRKDGSYDYGINTVEKAMKYGKLDEIDTSKPISKKIGNWVRPLTPSEKKQQKKKQLFNTLNKKEKEILEYIKKKDLSETFMFLLSE